MRIIKNHERSYVKRRAPEKRNWTPLFVRGKGDYYRIEVNAHLDVAEQMKIIIEVRHGGSSLLIEPDEINPSTGSDERWKHKYYWCGKLM